MNKSYADVLESYMIAEEGFVDKIKSGINKLEKWDRKKNPHKYAAIDKRKADKEKARKAELQRKKEKEEATEKSRIYLQFNRKKALEESGLNLNPLPDKDEKILNSSIAALVSKDLKMALPKILATKEVNDGIDEYCRKYNNCPKEERNEKFYDMAENYAPDTMTNKWVKSQFKIGQYIDENYFCAFECCKRSFYWRYGTNAILDVLIMYVSHRYMHYLTENDESGKGWIHFDLIYTWLNK